MQTTKQRLEGMDYIRCICLSTTLCLLVSVCARMCVSPYSPVNVHAYEGWISAGTSQSQYIANFNFNLGGWNHFPLI